MFVVDVPGTYVAQLIVHDGTVASAPDTVGLTTQNSPPVAQAGPDQTVVVGATVTLDGSGSSDVDDDPLTFLWALSAVPSDSVATLSDPTVVQPTFVVDQPGTYVGQLIVHDGTVASSPATVTISTHNSRPVADAGAPQTVVVGATVTLDGSGSSDVDGDPLTFLWALTAVPSGSAAVLSQPTTVTPTFVVDQVGTYVVQLIVHDGLLASTPVTVTMTAHVPAPPPLNANQITLSGITNGLVTVTGKTGGGIPGTTVALTNTRTGQKVTGTVQADGSFTLSTWLKVIRYFDPNFVASIKLYPLYIGTHNTEKLSLRHLQIAALRGDVFSFVVIDATGQQSSATTITAGSGLPPDPGTIAPPLSPSVATTLATATAFLYSGAAPTQTGVAPGTIDARRVAVLRGRVVDRRMTTLPGVVITILNHPEFGQTLSRADGMFDLAVNGGGPLTV